MMSVMPVITPAAGIIPSAPSGADKGAPRFAETLRSESAALNRSAQRAAGQEAHSLQEEREASVRTVGHEQQEQQEGEPAEKAAGPAPVASSPGEVGKSEVVAAGLTQEKGKIGGLKEEDLTIPAQVDQSQALPTWLLVSQPVALPSAAATAGVEKAASNSGARSIEMVAAAPISFAQAGFAQERELAGENAGLVAPRQAPVAPVVAANELPKAPSAAENIAMMAAAARESEVVPVRNPPGEVTSQAPRPTTTVAAAAPVNIETLISAGISGVSDNKVAALPIGDLLASFSPVVPEMTSRAATASPMAMSQGISPETLSQAATLVAFSQASNPEGADPAARVLALSQTPNPELMSQVARPVALGQLTNPETLSQVANPEALPQVTSPVSVSQVASPTVISSTLRGERPVLASGENAPMVDVARSGDPGLPTTVVASPAPADSASDQRQFADLARPVARKVEEAPSPVDSGRTEFSNLLTGSGQAVVSGSLRAAGSGQAIPAATSTLALDGRIVEQVVNRVNLSGASGETSLSLLLHPKELGEVRVELISGKDGLRAHLHSQSQMVQDVLERNLPRLREAFESQGLKVSDLQVSCDDRRNGGNAAFQQREQGQMPQAPYRMANSVARAAEAEWPGNLGATGSGWSATPGFSLRV